jgi:hypothetical protein
MPEELPAVTDPFPSVRNAGLSFASFSIEVSGRGNSSCAKACDSFPLPVAGITTGAISRSNLPLLRAAVAFSCDLHANVS